MKKVLCGIDRIRDADKLLRGKRVGLLSAASGIAKSGDATYEILRERYDLAALYAPEHGIRSNLQDGLWLKDGVDPETGLPLYNVGTSSVELLDAMIADIDVLVYDIQDVGARFYTYLYNLTDMMARLSSQKKPLVVLDRPNPIGGVAFEGPRLDEANCSSGIGRFSLPVRYGLTVGEYARWANAEKNIGCELFVIELDGWERSLYADETDLLFVNPSPNIPSVNAAINYIGTCLFEATNVSEGRGTTRPFDLVGAPFVDSKALCGHLRSKHIDGLTVRRAAFTPMFGKHAGKVCEGVELHVIERSVYRPLFAATCILEHMRQYDEFEFSAQGLALRYGNNDISGNYTPEELRDRAAGSLESFLSEAKRYMLYR